MVDFESSSSKSRPRIFCPFLVQQREVDAIICRLVGQYLVSRLGRLQSVITCRPVRIEVEFISRGIILFVVENHRVEFSRKRSLSKSVN